MHFGVNRKAARGQVGYVVQPLDNIGLPQGPRHIQRARVQPRHLDAQLAPVAGRGQGDVAQVEFHVKIGVLDPVGSVESAGHLDDSGAKQWHSAQAALKAGDNILEAHKAAGCCRWVVNSKSADMLRRVGLLQIDKGGVEYSQLFHVVLPLVVPWWIHRAVRVF